MTKAFPARQRGGQAVSPCPLLVGSVVRVPTVSRARNNRIRSHGALNRCCVFVPALESVMLAWTLENRFATLSAPLRPAAKPSGCLLIGVNRTSPKGRHFGSWPFEDLP